MAPIAPLPDAATVAAVIPAIDEAQALPGVLAEMPWDLLSEVIVVDGGSRDGTPEVASAAGARVVSEPRPGYGRACAAGAAATDAEVIAFLDGDGGDDPAELERVLRPILAGEACLSLGARATFEPGAMLPHQVLGNRLVAALVRVRFGLALRDIPPMRAIRADCLSELGMREMTYGWPTEMIVRAARAGLPIVQVDVRARARRGGRSKVAGRLVPSVKAGARMLAVVARSSRSLRTG